MDVLLTIHPAGSILRALDSVGLSILYWVFGFIIAAGMFPCLALFNYTESLQLLLQSTWNMHHCFQTGLADR